LDALEETVRAQGLELNVLSFERVENIFLRRQNYSPKT